MPLLHGKTGLQGVAFSRKCGVTCILWCSTLGKPRILGLLLVDVGLKVINITIQIIGIVEHIIPIVTKVMDIYIPLGSAQSALWCMFGIEVQGS